MYGLYSSQHGPVGRGSQNTLSGPGIGVPGPRRGTAESGQSADSRGGFAWDRGSGPREAPILDEKLAYCVPVV